MSAPRSKTLKSVEKSIGKLEGVLALLETEQENLKANLTIKCLCGTYHKIRDLRVIQTYWYTEPHGCTGGDYWSHGALAFLCPKDETYQQRILFNTSYFPLHRWEDRDIFEYDAGAQFSRWYKHLFKEVIKGTSENGHIKNGRRMCWQDIGSVNSYYIDKNRRKFGLVAFVKEYT